MQTMIEVWIKIGILVAVMAFIIIYGFLREMAFWEMVAEVGEMRARLK